MPSPSSDINLNMNDLNIHFFPMMAPGHTIPLVDMARRFARHGTNVTATIITTPHNASTFNATIEHERARGVTISIRLVPFPCAEAGLPDHCQSLSSVTSPELSSKFIKALGLLRQPVEQLLAEARPDCIVSDFLFPWTNDVAKKLGIPRLIFHGAGFFPLCVFHSLIKHKPFRGIVSDSEMFVVPGLPDVIKMSRRQLPDYLREEEGSPVRKAIENGSETEAESYGIVVNSFYELEPAYVEHYRRKVGRRVWHVGPVSLCNRDDEDKARRGSNNDDNNNNNEKKCVDWLSRREPNSVVYVSFGTVSVFSDDQLRELAIGLECSGRDFIWAVRREKEEGEWMPEGFAERVEERGLLIKGWAPQVLILEHESIGGFLTHCGWNSLLEGVTAGVPMITWPISSEQFDNEKLVTEVLKIGVGVGVEEWSKRTDVEKRGVIRGADIAKAVKEVMSGEESVEMRSRVGALSSEAKRAVEKGGSSYNDLDLLLEELRLNKKELGMWGV